MSPYFTISAWGPSANFDLLRLNFDWLRHPEHGYFSVTACLFGFGVCVTFHPHIEPDPKDFDFDAWVATTHVVVPTPEYDALKADAEAWRAMRELQPETWWEDPVTGVRAKFPFPGALRGPIIRIPSVDSPTKTQGLDYLAGFGPNVPVEDLGGKPVGMEKAP